MKAVLPKHLCDIEAVEMIYGPPPEVLTEQNFRSYQTWMSDLIYADPPENSDGIYLGAEMGLGKTGATLHAAARLLAEGTVKRVLVVAPVRVAEETWPTEIAKWSFARGLTYRVITGTQAERVAALKYDDAQITIINRENVRWLVETIGTRRWRFDMIVYDEASRLKRGKKRTKGTTRKDGSTSPKRLTELGVFHLVRHKTKRFVELSGTPSPNGLIDLYGPIYALDGGFRLGSSMSAFEQRWFSLNPYTRRQEPAEHAEAEIMEKLKGIFFSLREEDYLTLPPMVEVDHRVKLPKKVMDRYRDFETEMAMEVQSRSGDTEVIEAVNNGVLTNKLLQIANGAMYLGDKFDPDTEKKLPREFVKLHEAKLDALDSIMEEAAGAPVLVAYSFQFDKLAIKKRFPYARIFGESPHDMRDWNAGKIKMLVTHPASAGHGLNFQHGSNIAVWYGLTWSLELYRQFIKRLHRSGQKADRVFLHRILAAQTADEDILPALTARGATQDRISDAVRVRLRRAA